MSLPAMSLGLRFCVSRKGGVIESRLGPTNPDSNYFFKALLRYIKALR